MKMKKTRNILLITTAVLVALFFYGKHNFKEDKQTLSELMMKAGAGEITYALDKAEGIESFQNPIVNFIYQRWKNKIY